MLLAAITRYAIKCYVFQGITMDQIKPRVFFPSGANDQTTLEFRFHHAFVPQKTVHTTVVWTVVWVFLFVCTCIGAAYAFSKIKQKNTLSDMKTVFY